MSFGTRLKELREQKGLTQREMAKILNISEYSYQRYEYDKSYPSYKNLIFIADFFKVSLDYLTDRLKTQSEEN